jgi:hypothetical protein
MPLRHYRGFYYDMAKIRILPFGPLRAKAWKLCRNYWSAYSDTLLLEKVEESYIKGPAPFGSPCVGIPASINYLERSHVPFAALVHEGMVTLKLHKKPMTAYPAPDVFKCMFEYVLPILSKNSEKEPTTNYPVTREEEKSATSFSGAPSENLYHVRGTDLWVCRQKSHMGKLYPVNQEMSMFFVTPYSCWPCPYYNQKEGSYMIEGLRLRYRNMGLYMPSLAKVAVAKLAWTASRGRDKKRHQFFQNAFQRGVGTEAWSLPEHDWPCGMCEKVLGSRAALKQHSEKAHKTPKKNRISSARGKKKRQQANRRRDRRSGRRKERTKFKSQKKATMAQDANIVPTVTGGTAGKKAKTTTRKKKTTAARTTAKKSTTESKRSTTKKKAKRTAKKPKKRGRGRKKPASNVGNTGSVSTHSTWVRTQRNAWQDLPMGPDRSAGRRASLKALDAVMQAQIDAESSGSDSGEWKRQAERALRRYGVAKKGGSLRKSNRIRTTVNYNEGGSSYDEDSVSEFGGGHK